MNFKKIAILLSFGAVYSSAASAMEEGWDGLNRTLNTMTNTAFSSAWPEVELILNEKVATYKKVSNAVNAPVEDGERKFSQVGDNMIGNMDNMLSMSPEELEAEFQRITSSYQSIRGERNVRMQDAFSHVAKK